MKYIYILLTIFVFKIIYDFLMWMYGYYLRIKWIDYFKTKNKNYISYSYQIEKYLNSVPNALFGNDLFVENLYNDYLKSFIKAHGYYKHKFLLNFWPFYWINLVLFLPQNILLYLNPRYKKRTLHIFNVIYWIGVVIFNIYNDEIISFIKDLLNSLIEYFLK